MRSKVSSTFGLRSASIAESETEFSRSSSSSKPSGGAASPSNPSGGACGGRAGGGIISLRRLLAVRTGVSRLEIDDVAQQDLGVVELVAPDDDGLEGERAFTQACDHRLAAGLDPLGDGDFALARQKLDRAHLA